MLRVERARMAANPPTPIGRDGRFGPPAIIHVSIAALNDFG